MWNTPQGSSGGRQDDPRPARSGGWQGGGLEGGGVRLLGWGKAPAELTSRQGRKVGAKRRARDPACAPRNPEARRPACHREGGGLPPPDHAPGGGRLAAPRCSVTSYLTNTSCLFSSSDT